MADLSNPNPDELGSEGKPYAGMTGASLGRIARSRPLGRTRGLRARLRGIPGEVEVRGKLRMLEETLRQIAAVNVRQPSHLEPPFGAIPFVADDHANIIGPTVAGTLLAGTFDGNDSVPVGMRAQIRTVAVYAYEITFTSATDPATVVFWTLRRNGIAVPGYARVPALGPIFVVAPVVASGGLESSSRCGTVLPTVAHFYGGDTYDVQIVNTDAALTYVVGCRVTGWLYQPRTSGSGLAGTVAD